MNKKNTAKVELGKSSYLYRIYSGGNYTFPLKRSLSGYEGEITVLDSKGYVSEKADGIIKRVRARKKNIVVPEVAKHILEVHSYPTKSVFNTSLDFLENISIVSGEAEKEGLKLFPFGSYPGKISATLAGKRYKLLAEIVGKKYFTYYGPRGYGFHYHYSLPRGVFDKKKRFLKKSFASKTKESLLDSFNFLTAIDPLLIALLQSSPFIEGKCLSKDSRVLFNRTEKSLKSTGFLYRYPEMGNLSGYVHTLTDLTKSLKRKDRIMRDRMKELGYKKEAEKKPVLDFIWVPVKINKLGTIESRGGDMNMLSRIFPVTFLIKSVLREIQQNFLHVIPSDTALECPFRHEEKVVFIPPHSFVKEELQAKAVFHGLSDPDVLNYCKRFLFFARKLAEEKNRKMIKRLSNVLEKKETVSDQMIKYAKRKGFSLEEELPNDFCAEMALHFSGKFLKDLAKTRKIMESEQAQNN